MLCQSKGFGVVSGQRGLMFYINRGHCCVRVKGPSVVSEQRVWCCVRVKRTSTVSVPRNQCN